MKLPSRPAVALALAPCVLGCTTPEQKIESAAHTVRSWSATTEATSNALRDGSVPLVYGVQILQAAEQAKSEAAAATEWNAIPASTRGELEHGIARLDSLLRQVHSTPVAHE